MKSLIEYTLTTKSKQDVTYPQEDGSKKVVTEEIDVPIKVILKSPSRVDSEKAKQLYQVELSNAIRAGILDRAVLAKIYRQNDGILTNNELKQVEEIQKRIQEIRAEYQKIPTENQSESDKKKIDDLVNEFTAVTEQLTQLEESTENLFVNSAESVASGKQQMWNLLFLSYIEKDGKIQPVVPGDTLEERLDNFDKILDNQESDESKSQAALYNQILLRNGFFINLLSKGKADQSQLTEINSRIDSGEIVL